jgi:hypothetical protein
VDRQLVGENMPAARRLDRVDIADEVSDGDVRRCQLLDVALVALEPRDGRVVALRFDCLTTELRDRSEGAVIDLAPGNDGNRVVEQRD